MDNFSEGSRESFKGLTDLLKDIALKRGITITDTDIADKLGISLASLQAYYQTQDVPASVFSQLREQFPQIANATVQEIWFTDIKEVDYPEDEIEHNEE